MKNKHILENIKKYKQNSLYFSYLKSILVLVVIFVLIYVVIISAYTQYISHKEADNEISKELIKAGKVVDMVLNDTDKFYKSAIYNNSVDLFLTMKEKPYIGKQNDNIISNIYENVLKYVSESDYITGVYLYSNECEYVLSNIVGGEIEKYADELWYKQYMSTKKAQMLLSEKNKKTGRYDLIICKEMNNFGLFVIKLDIENVIAKLVLDKEYENENFFITDDEYIIRYSCDETMIGKSLSEIININELKTMKNSDVFTNVTSKYAQGVLKSDNVGAYAMRLTRQSITKNISETRNIVFIGTVVIIGFLVLLSIVIASKLYQSIIKILAVLNSADNVTGEGGFDESIYITNKILNIINNNKKIESEMTTRLQMLNQSKLVALQTQINPHFLFNTLQMVNLSIISENGADTEATKIISLLSELLRITLSTRENIIPIALEIKHIDKYIQIQNIKFENRVVVKFDISPETENLKCIKLVMQPIIENSIIHGLQDEETILNIFVQVRCKNDNLDITITDDGVGIEPNKLEAIKNMLQNEELPQNSHIGIANVNQRIRLIFGKNYGVHISSLQSRGTKVEIIMPLIDDLNNK